MKKTFQIFLSLVLAINLVQLPFGLSQAQTQTYENAKENKKRVALHILLTDGVAISERADDLYSHIFSKLRPDLTYKSIIVNTTSFGVQLFGIPKSKRKISLELQEKLKNILNPDERLAYLLINTHGKTIYEESEEDKTHLLHVGKIAESEVDSDFFQNFDPIKDKAENNLQIILNSCSVFCGEKTKVTNRARTVLEYFGAHSGGIYGADVNEVSEEFSNKVFFKKKYFLPGLHEFLNIMILSIYFSPMFWGPLSYQVISQQYIVGEISYSRFLTMTGLSTLVFSAATGLGINFLWILLKPFYLNIVSKAIKNRGYYFAFKNGQLIASSKVKKYQEIPNIIQGKIQHLICRELFL